MTTYQSESNRSHTLNVVEVVRHHTFGYHRRLSVVINKVIVMRLDQVNPLLVIHEHTCEHGAEWLWMLGDLCNSGIWISEPRSTLAVVFEVVTHCRIYQGHTCFGFLEECRWNLHRIQMKRLFSSTSCMFENSGFPDLSLITELFSVYLNDKRTYIALNHSRQR